MSTPIKVAICDVTVTGDSILKQPLCFCSLSVSANAMALTS